MQMSSSANRTCSACSSASEYTATVLMPSSRQATRIRSAISPRLAMRIFLNMWLLGADGEQPLAELHGLPVLDVGLHHFALVLGVDLVHQLHRLDDAEHLALPDGITDFDERAGTRLRRAIERADDRRLHDCQLHLSVILGRRRRGIGGSG